MDNQTEPKQTVEDMVDAALAEPGAQPGEQPQESSPATEQPIQPKVDGSDPAKTPITPAETGEKGFASHPAWQQREAKLKEAREALSQAQAREQRYLKLLDDLEKRQAAAKPAGSPQDRYQQLAEKVCAKNGWNINQLSPEQLAYVHDQTRLTLGLIEEFLPSALDDRIKPLEAMSERMKQQEQLNTEEVAVKEIAATQFPMFKWDEHIRPAISKVLNDLDERDPERTIRLSYEDIFYRAIVPLYKEYTESKGRQEARDAVKPNARPLGRAPSTPVNEKAGKPGKPIDYVEKELDKMGIR